MKNYKLKRCTLLFLFLTVSLGGCSGLGGSADDSDDGSLAAVPAITSTSPEDGETDVVINKTVIVTFSEAMDDATILSSGNFTLTDGVTEVSGTVDYDSENNVATFTPDSNLDADTTYSATVTDVEDLTGDTLESDEVWSFTTGTEEAVAVDQDDVFLGSSSTFAILASAAITNIPTSNITGDVGLTPDAGSNVSGFSEPDTCPEITGTLYTVDSSGPACADVDATLISDAKDDVEAAFTDARDSARGTPSSISGNLNGLTLYPGVYESGTSIEISAGGFLYLDALGDSAAVFVIRSETSITTESTSEVILAGGALAENVYWTAGSAITLGTNSIMKGTMIAGTSISLLTGANLEGRALNQGASAEAITLDSATITVP